MILRVFLSLPHQLERTERVNCVLASIKRTMEGKGYTASSPESVIGLDDMDSQALVRLSMLVACDTVWFPKDFERSALSVGEYNYAWALNKKIVIDPVRRMLD